MTYEEAVRRLAAQTFGVPLDAVESSSLDYSMDGCDCCGVSFRIELIARLGVPAAKGEHSSYGWGGVVHLFGNVDEFASEFLEAVLP